MPEKGFLRISQVCEANLSFFGSAKGLRDRQVLHIALSKHGGSFRYWRELSAVEIQFFPEKFRSLEQTAHAQK